MMSLIYFKIIAFDDKIITYSEKLVSANMLTGQHKAFCVLRFSKCESIIAVKRDFRRRYGIDAPTTQSIRRWYKQFEETGCLCKGKSTGRPSVSDDNVERIRETERVLNAVRASQPIVQVENYKSHKQLFGVF